MTPEPDFDAVARALGYRFQDSTLLRDALTHRSFANEYPTRAPRDNERLEFLGDAVLGLVVAEALFELHPEWQEGELTRVRSRLVSREHMAQVAEEIGLGDYLRLSKGEERSGLRYKGTVLSNAMEAVLGAVFVDGGLDPVRAFARQRVMGHAVEQLAEELSHGDALGNYKAALQERLQAAHAGSPVYRVKSESGPPHRKQFVVEVRLKRGREAAGEPLARGKGGAKKLAEQDAARRALEHLDAVEAGAADGGIAGGEREKL